MDAINELKLRVVPYHAWSQMVSILSFIVELYAPTQVLNVKSKANGEYCGNSKIVLVNTIGASLRLVTYTFDYLQDSRSNNLNLTSIKGVCFLFLERGSNRHVLQGVDFR